MPHQADSVFRRDAFPIQGLNLTITDRFLHLRSEQTLRVLSTAVLGGGLRRLRQIVSMHVSKDYDGANPQADLRGAAEELGIREPFVGLMTAVRLREAIVRCDEQVPLVLVATVGVGNAWGAGRMPAHELRPQPTPPGTINLILVSGVRLTTAALAGAILTATEAKALALVERNVRAPDGAAASGTSTDSVVVASTGSGPPLRYSGPATAFGATLGRLVRESVLEALESR